MSLFPDPSGVYAVGCSDRSLAEIPVSVFYPGEVTDGGAKRRWWWTDSRKDGRGGGGIHPYAEGLVAASKLPRSVGWLVSSLSWLKTKCYEDIPVVSTAMRLEDRERERGREMEHERKVGGGRIFWFLALSDFFFVVVV